MSNRSKEKNRAREYEIEKLKRQRSISKKVDKCLTDLNMMAIFVLDEKFRDLAKLQEELRVNVLLMDKEIGDLLMFLAKSKDIKKG